MHCPDCGAEYEEGVFRCPDCEVMLESERPAPASHPSEEFVEAIRTTDLAFMTVLKSLLDSSDIPYFVQGEEGYHMLPVGLSGGFLHPKTLGMVLRVRESDVGEVRQLIERIESDLGVDETAESKE